MRASVRVCMRAQVQVNVRACVSMCARAGDRLFNCFCCLNDSKSQNYRSICKERAWEDQWLFQHQLSQNVRNSREIPATSCFAQTSAGRNPSQLCLPELDRICQQGPKHQKRPATLSSHNAATGYSKAQRFVSQRVSLVSELINSEVIERRQQCNLNCDHSWFAADEPQDGKFPRGSLSVPSSLHSTHTSTHTHTPAQTTHAPNGATHAHTQTAQHTHTLARAHIILPLHVSFNKSNIFQCACNVCVHANLRFHLFLAVCLRIPHKA